MVICYDTYEQLTVMGMELKEYIEIIRKNKYLFLVLLLLPLGVSLVWNFSRPDYYNASMSIEIAREGTEQTEDYEYDQYYRLQADKDFADNVVSWLKDPAVVFSIYSSSGLPVGDESLRSLSKSFRAEKMAGNYIQVFFKSAKKEDGEKISNSIGSALSEKTSQLNNENQGKNWFKLIFGKPIMVKEDLNLWFLAGISLAGGFLLAVIGVMVRHYMASE